jgi:hypothetical protein
VAKQVQQKRMTEEEYRRWLKQQKDRRHNQ